MGGFLVDSWIICMIADNLYNHGLFAQSQAIHAIADMCAILQNF
jgi:hypothetical protein